MPPTISRFHCWEGLRCAPQPPAPLLGKQSASRQAGRHPSPCIARTLSPSPHLVPHCMLSEAFFDLHHPAATRSLPSPPTPCCPHLLPSAQAERQAITEADEMAKVYWEVRCCTGWVGGL